MWDVSSGNCNIVALAPRLPLQIPPFPFQTTVPTVDSNAAVAGPRCQGVSSRGRPECFSLSSLCIGMHPSPVQALASEDNGLPGFPACFVTFCTRPKEVPLPRTRLDGGPGGCRLAGSSCVKIEVGLDFASPMDAFVAWLASCGSIPLCPV